MLITKTIDVNDLDIITEWWYVEWNMYYTKMGIQNLKDAQEKTRRDVESQNMTILVAREGSTMLAACALMNLTIPEFPRAHNWIANVYTLEVYRHYGYGSRLIREAFRYACGTLEWDELYLVCSPDHTAWYSKLGFDVISSTDIIDVMRKDIAPLSPIIVSPIIESV